MTCSSCGGYATLPCWLNKLPSRAICDRLILSFVQTVHPVVPLLHLPSFKRDYERFWNEHQDQEWHEAPPVIIAEESSLVPCLFSMIFASLMANPMATQNDSELRKLDPKVLFDATMATLGLTGFPRRPSLYSLSAFLFSQNTLIREEEPTESFSFISIAFRAALGMGLHRDPSEFHLGAVITEVRRRIWWHILHIDSMVSCRQAYLR